METFVRSAIGATIVTFKGAFDTPAASAAEKQIKALLATDQKKLILDLTDVPYIASSGLRILLMVLKTTRAVQGDTRLAGAIRTVREILKVTGLDTIFHIYPDVDSALEQFAMDINETTLEGAMVINLVGAIEPPVAPFLLDRLRGLFNRASGRAVLNLSKVPYASMEGLRALQEAKTAATGVGVDLRLAGVDKALKEAFDLKGITAQFQIFPKVEAAVASFPKR